jgi:mRNA interferase MazF
VLAGAPNVVQVVPLTSTLRGYASEVEVAADGHGGLTVDSAAQCQHIRVVAVARIGDRLGNVGPGILARIRDNVGVLLDL